MVLLSTAAIFNGCCGIMTKTTEEAFTIHGLFGALITQSIKKTHPGMTGGGTESVKS